MLFPVSFAGNLSCSPDWPLGSPEELEITSKFLATSLTRLFSAPEALPGTTFLGLLNPRLDSPLVHQEPRACHLA